MSITYKIRRFPLFTTMTVQEWLNSLALNMNEELISVVYRPLSDETVYYFKKAEEDPPIGLVEKKDLKISRSRGRPRKLIIEKVA
jgi:hypothetical protein